MKRLNFLKIYSSWQLLLLLIIASNTACVGYKDIIILEENVINRDTSYVIENRLDNVLQKNDRVLVHVASIDPEKGALFNQQSFIHAQNQMQMMQGGGNQMNGQRNNQNNNNLLTTENNNTWGYLIDADGNIELPVVGTVQIAGMKLEEAKKKLYELIDEYMVNYSVDIQLINRRITVTGEVFEPGLVELDRMDITLFEALERAGGLTQYSMRDRLVLIRETPEGNRRMVNLNLKEDYIVNSPYYYVQPNDVIYVQPIRAKKWAVQSSFTALLGITSSLISLVALIVALNN